jgi:small subunit ribosomal protein S16
MAVKIRLRRMGMKKAPYYRVVVADGRSPRDGRFIESIGIYHPTEEPSRIEVDADKARDWLAKGAQPTEAVVKILEIAGVTGPAEARKVDKARRAKLKANT